MNYGEVLHNAPSNLKKLFRKLERLKLKIISSTWSLTFNNVCLQENILPNYTYFLIIL